LSQDIRADARFITTLTHEQRKGALDVFDVRKLNLAVRIVSITNSACLLANFDGCTADIWLGKPLRRGGMGH
jgi:hypothetical protein